MSTIGTVRKIGMLILRSKNGSRRDLACGAGVELFVIVLGIASPYGLKMAIDSLSAQRTDFAVWGVLAFIAFWVATAVLAGVTLIFTNRLCNEICRFMLLEALSIRLPIAATESNIDTGMFQGVFERLPYSLQTIIEGLLWRIVPLVLQVIVTILVITIIVSPKYAILTLIVLVAHALISYHTSLQYEEQAMSSNMAAANLSGSLGDLLRNAQRAVFNGATVSEIRHIGKVATDKRNADVRMSLLLVWAAIIQYGVIGVGITIILIMGIFDVNEGKITLGDFILLQAYILNFATPIASYGFVLRQTGVSAANIEDALAYLPEGRGVGAGEIQLALSEEPAPIVVQNVHFSYDEQQVITGVNLEVPAGAFTVIVGANGSGKSTFARLLAKLLLPSHGTITVGRQVPDDIANKGTRNILYVPQQVTLFNRSLRENGLYPPTTLLEQQLNDLLVELSFYDDGRQIDFSIDVGEHGSRLSGGQIQKLELARVSHIDLPVIILDETTSALDARSEQIVIDLLRRTRKSKSTLILISHRPYAAENADLVVFMQGGNIIAKGTHADLLRTDPTYCHYWAQHQTDATDH